MRKLTFRIHGNNCVSAGIEKEKGFATASVIVVDGSERILVSPFLPGSHVGAAPSVEVFLCGDAKEVAVEYEKALRTCITLSYLWYRDAKNVDEGCSALTAYGALDDLEWRKHAH